MGIAHLWCIVPLAELSGVAHAGRTYTSMPEALPMTEAMSNDGRMDTSMPEELPMSNDWRMDASIPEELPMSNDGRMDASMPEEIPMSNDDHSSKALRAWLLNPRHPIHGLFPHYAQLHAQLVQAGMIKQPGWIFQQPVAQSKEAAWQGNNQESGKLEKAAEKAAQSLSGATNALIKNEEAFKELPDVCQELVNVAKQGGLRGCPDEKPPQESAQPRRPGLAEDSWATFATHMSLDGFRRYLNVRFFQGKLNLTATERDVFLQSRSAAFPIDVEHFNLLSAEASELATAHDKEDRIAKLRPQNSHEKAAVRKDAVELYLLDKRLQNLKSAGSKAQGTQWGSSGEAILGHLALQACDFSIESDTFNLLKTFIKHDALGVGRLHIEHGDVERFVRERYSFLDAVGFDEQRKEKVLDSLNRLNDGTGFLTFATMQKVDKLLPAFLSYGMDQDGFILGDNVSDGRCRESLRNQMVQRSRWMESTQENSESSFKGTRIDFAEFLASFESCSPAE